MMLRPPTGDLELNYRTGTHPLGYMISTLFCQGISREWCMSAAPAAFVLLNDSEQGVSAVRTAISQQHATDMMSITAAGNDCSTVTIWVSNTKPSRSS